MKIQESNNPFLPLHPVVGIAAFNLLLLIFLILIFCSTFSKPSGFEIRMPQGVVDQALKGDQNISISAENVLFLNNSVVTLNELKRNLTKTDLRNQTIYIHINKRSSMGRVMDVWDLCRALGSSRVHIVSGEEI